MRIAIGNLLLVSLLTVTARVSEGADSASPEKNGAAIENFDRTIAPVLARRCLSCHNGTEKKGKLDLSQREAAFAGGESGKVIAAGDLKKSLLWEKISEGEMPPKKPLPAAEKELLRNWIASGAAWGTERVDPFRFTTEARAGYDWWSLQAVRRPEVPAGLSRAGENSVDAFIRAKLAEQKFELATPADRRTLIRRVTFDLTGLPPTRDEMEAFLADSRPDAYEQLVDRLLASPRYGERWARHWLDVARFGESNGFEYDQLRDRAWPYRDWVIEAFNSDLPYTEFVRQQLAADILNAGDARAVRATGFLVAGPFDGLSPAGEVMRQIMRQDVMEDFVGAVGQSFLGLTTNCARCHDHKFDPIRQVDYYRLAAALAGVTHGERDLPTGPRGREIDRQIEEANRQLVEIERPVRAAILRARKERKEPAPLPSPIARWVFDTDLKDQLGKLHGRAVGTAKLAGEALQVDGETAYVTTATIDRTVSEKTLEVWVRLADLGQKGGAAISLQTVGGEVFDAIVFGELEDRRWMAGSNGYSRSHSFGGPVEDEAVNRPVQFAITYQADGTITGFRDGKPYGSPYRSSGPVKFEAGKAELVFGLRHAPVGKNKMLRGAIVKAQLYDRALSAAEVAASAGVPTDYVSAEELAKHLSAEQRSAVARIREQIQKLGAERAGQVATKIYAIVPTEPATTHVLLRGNPLQPGVEVTPGGVAAVVPAKAEFGLSGGASDGERRAKLAEWITDPSNPLFARVIVNRLWQYHFGVGLVASPNDFGFNGGRPSHPELLDWLASELAGRNYSLKEMQRLIVTSATYRQSSRVQATAGKADPSAVDSEARLLWRKSPLRLEAEVARDAVLAVAGELNTKMGGPGYYDFKTYVHKSTRYYDPIDVAGANEQRRSVYRTWARGGRNPLLDTFDCPDPSTATPRRAVTTTPLQALSLLNSPFILRMSERLAERLEREAGGDEVGKVRRLLVLAYGREPTETERVRLVEFAQQRGWPALCRVVFNSNEFLYVE